MPDLAYRTATDLCGALRRGEVGSRELLMHLLQRVERLNPALNAVVTLDAERALARADAADAARARGEHWGPLHGLPMTVKDSIETAGLRTTSGAPVFAQHVPQADASAVRRLKAAGAIIFGKTNLPALATDVQTFNALFGTTRNPWDLSRSPGGSSGGAAVALAAGMTPLELGSDIGGSIRNPAHYCGVYGHKPSHGIVSGRGHIPGPPGTRTEIDIGVLGPMARSADDLALALGILAGPDEDRAVAWRWQIPAARSGQLQGFRVAAWLDDPACAVDHEVTVCLQRTVDTLHLAGVAVDEQARPGISFDEATSLYWLLLFAATSPGASAAELEECAADALTLDPADRSADAQWARGRSLSHRDWLIAHEARERQRQRWAAFFERHDVLLCPVTPTAAIPHDHSMPEEERPYRVNGQPRPYWDQVPWAGLVGAVGLPATVAPIGFTSSGLPVGVQIVGPHLEDGTPIAFARHLSRVLGGFSVPPAIDLGSAR
jgi:amidase